MVTSFGADSRRENTILCKLHMLQDGDRFIIPAFLVDKELQVGDHYPEDGDKYAMVCQVIRKEKPWWAFWRKPHIVAYEFVYYEEGAHAVFYNLTFGYESEITQDE